MLDNNTNKVVWVGVAVGVVSLLGISALVMFPQLTNTMKPAIRDTVLVPFAGPAHLHNGDTYHLTYDKNYMSAWNVYSIKLYSDKITINPRSYVYFEIQVTPNKDTSIQTDINDSLSPTETPVENDLDDVSYRHFTITDDSGNTSSGTKGRESLQSSYAKLKAGKTYTYGIYLRNTRDVPLYMYDSDTTNLVFQPTDGLGPDKPLDVKLTHFKMNQVGF